MPNSGYVSDEFTNYRAGILSLPMSSESHTNEDVQEIVMSSAYRTSKILSLAEIANTKYLFVISGGVADDIIHSANVILVNIRKQFQGKSTICMSSPKTSLDHLANAVCEAMYTSESRFNEENASILFYSDQPLACNENVPQQTALIKQYVDLLAGFLGNTNITPEKMQTEIDALFNHCRSLSLPGNVARSIWCDVLIGCSFKILDIVKNNTIVTESIEKEFSRAQILSASSMQNIQQVVTEKLLRIQAILRNAGKNTATIKDTLDYLLQTECSQVTLQYVADYLGISASYLSYSFKKQNQRNFRNYVHQYKMELAADYLLNSQLLVSEIAIKLGYTDIINFSRVFKKYYNISPSEYRSTMQMQAIGA